MARIAGVTLFHADSGGSGVDDVEAREGGRCLAETRAWNSAYRFFSRSTGRARRFMPCRNTCFASSALFTLYSICSG